jgi:1,4-dihydroxy-2-naphthoate octaprenyltransferase
MTKKIKAWIGAIRPRTLPLSVAGVILASFISYSQQLFDVRIFILTILTTLLLQILSNLANDFGDYKHGTDNDKRVGPTRALQSGVLTTKNIKTGLYIVSALTLISGIILLFVAFGTTINYLFLIFLILGIFAIGTAIKYTVGKNPFGYNGFGDIMVFIFFGIVSVCGSYFLFTKNIDYTILLPAMSIGLLSTGVLNINNMRDIENDKSSNKMTIAVKMGISKSKIYHTVIITLSMFLFVLYLFIINKIDVIISLIIPATPLFYHLLTVVKNKKLSELDKELKKLALITLFVSIWIGVGIIL